MKDVLIKVYYPTVHETVAFWDAYLKGDSAAKAYLASDALARFSHGAARVDRK
jgi:hypothetical protein